ncbi:MAG: cytochrome-c peroxidase [Acidobacteria bacterium]|nr:cytochrome-c peroxidase [Acidobacteriota bacterium]
MQRFSRSALALGVAALALVAARQESLEARGGAAGPYGLRDMEIPVPPDNPLSPGRITLGEQLFFDKRLSKTKAMSCETCHVPEKGWTDGLAFSPKFDGSLNTRHTPTLYGVAYAPELYWDGRAKGLEAQIVAAWKGQMGADPDAIAKELDGIRGYRAAFEREMGGPPTGDRIVKALASFVRTIHAADTPFDRMEKEPRQAKSDAVQGFKVFSETARCTLCHLPPLYSDTLFHNVGIGFEKETPDLGRGKFLADAAARAGQPAPAEAETAKGAFKTPSLRGVAVTGPYFHDGRAATLEESVDLMVKGGIPNPHLDEKLKPATLTAAERRKLLAFLESLTPEGKPYTRPRLP